MSPTEAPEALRCPRCGAAMNPEQDWCLDCGYAATTRVVPPPGWGLPALIIAIVAAVVGLTLALTVDVLSSDSENAVGGASVATRSAPARARKTTTESAQRTTTTATTATGIVTSTVPGAAEATGGGAVSEWPKDKSAYSVIVLSTSDKSAAEKKARELAGDQEAGILRSDDYDFFSPGAWVVWVGQYDDKPAAQAAMDKSQISDGAYVTLVRSRNSGQ